MKRDFIKNILLTALFSIGLIFTSCKKETEADTTIETTETETEAEIKNLDTIATETDTIVTTGKQEMSADEQVP